MDTSINLMKEAYEMQIFTQKISYELMKDAYINEASGDSMGKRFTTWIKETTNKIASTLRSWLAAIVKFFTVTIPNFVKGIVEKVNNFIKRKSKKKNISLPKETPPEDKQKIENIADNVNKVNTAKAATELTGDNKEHTEVINNAEQKVSKQIELIPPVYDEVKKELKASLKDGEQVSVNGDKKEEEKVKCIRLKDDVLKSLNSITEAANNTMEMIDNLIEGFESVTTAQLKLANPADILAEVKDQYQQLQRLTYARHRTSLLREKKIISPQEINAKPYEWITVKEVQANLNMFSANKNADNLKKAATDKINKLLKLLADVNKTWSTTTHADTGKELVNILNNICNIFMKYYTDIAKEYGNYVSYAVNFYKTAITGAYNGK